MYRGIRPRSSNLLRILPVQFKVFIFADLFNSKLSKFIIFTSVSRANNLSNILYFCQRINVYIIKKDVVF